MHKIALLMAAGASIAYATADAAASEPTVKSIVNPKYRDKYKQAAAKDWLSKLLDDEASKTKTVKVTKPNPANADEKITVDETRPDGVDVDKLFKIATNNGVNIANLQPNVGNHGFAGRARMTIANGLRRVIKERHGLFNLGGTFILAPADMLLKVGADADPTHNQDGTKIVKVKPPEAPATAKPEPADPKAAKAAAKATKAKGGSEEA